MGWLRLECAGAIIFWTLATNIYLSRMARIQSITTMAFTLGTPLGALWGGIAVDRFGPKALAFGAGMLAILSLLTITFGKHLGEDPIDSK